MDDMEWLTAKQIATDLQVSEQVVWKWIRTGQLPALKIGKVYRIAKSDYQDFLNKHRNQPHR